MRSMLCAVFALALIAVLLFYPFDWRERKFQNGEQIGYRLYAGFNNSAEVLNPDGITGTMGYFAFGERCTIEAGSSSVLTVVSKFDDETLYVSYANPGAKAFSNHCPSGTIFAMEKKDLTRIAELTEKDRDFHDKQEKRRQEIRDKLKDFLTPPTSAPSSR